MRSCIATVSRVDVATAASIWPRSDTARWSAICSAVTTVSAMASSMSSAKRASAADRSPRWARTYRARTSSRMAAGATRADLPIASCSPALVTSRSRSISAQMAMASERASCAAPLGAQPDERRRQPAEEADGDGGHDPARPPPGERGAGDRQADAGRRAGRRAARQRRGAVGGRSSRPSHPPTTSSTPSPSAAPSERRRAAATTSRRPPPGLVRAAGGPRSRGPRAWCGAGR